MIYFTSFLHLYRYTEENIITRPKKGKENV